MLAGVMNQDRLLTSLKQHEGLRLKPYVDTTGNITIGYGLNLSAGITQFEADWLLEQRVQKAIYQASKAVDCFETLTPARQEVIVEMIYNLGLNGFLSFKRFNDYTKNNDYNSASHALLFNNDGQPTKWSKQVGQRARTLAEKYKVG